MGDRHRVGWVIINGALLLTMGACVPLCGIGAKFTLNNARVDPTFSCPDPATNYPYDVHVMIDADNSTANSVSIKSISETWKNVSIHGAWSGTLGDHGTTSIETFTPKSVDSGSKATIRFVIAFQCSDSSPATTTYGDFSFTFVVLTSARTYKLDSGNLHRLLIP